MNDLTRYEVAPRGSAERMMPAADGEWVLFEDVERMLLEIARLKVSNEHLAAGLDAADEEMRDLRKTLDKDT